MGFLWMLYVFSFVLALSVDDWFVTWMGLEINMMVFIVIIYQSYSMSHIESCMKYFFIQGMSSAMFMSFMYGYSEMFEYCVSLVMSLKLGAGPGYFWFPSICQGVSWMSCLLLMTVQKLIPLMLLTMFSGWIMWMVIILSLVVGGFGSLNQVNLKAIFAFSSIHHMGWMIMCGMVEGELSFYYLIVYGMVVFGIIYLLNYYNVMSLMMFDWKCSWWILLGVLSLAGVPPLLGFFLSWLVFYYVIQINSFVLFVMVVMSVIMLYVYVRIIYDVLFGKSMKNSWLNYLGLRSLSVDLVGIMGIVLGSLLVLMFCM